MPCKGTVLSCLPESWMCVNKCTEICSRLLEYTITNINVVRYNPSCENICVGTDSRHLWKPLEHFFSLCCLDFPQNYILNYMLPKKKKKKRQTKRQKLEYFCSWPYSGLGQSLLEHHFQALLKSLLLCQKITLCFFRTVHTDRVQFYSKKLVRASLCFQPWLCKYCNLLPCK